MCSISESIRTTKWSPIQKIVHMCFILKLAWQSCPWLPFARTLIYSIAGPAAAAECARLASLSHVLEATVQIIENIYEKLVSPDDRWCCNCKWWAIFKMEQAKWLIVPRCTVFVMKSKQFLLLLATFHSICYKTSKLIKYDIKISCVNGAYNTYKHRIAIEQECQLWNCMIGSAKHLAWLN